MPKVISDAQILNAALDVITQRGYTESTTREIADAAGINEVTLFRRFGNKQKLLTAAVEQEAKNFAAAGVEYTGDVEADLQRVVDFYQNLMRTHGQMIRMLLSEMPKQPELAEVMQTPIAIIGKICTIIKQYQEEDILLKEAPMQSFTALIGPIFIGGILEFVLPEMRGASFSSTEHVQRYLAGRYTNKQNTNEQNMKAQNPPRL